MKRKLVGWVVVAMVCIADAAEERYRTFTNAQGKTIQAKIIEYDVEKNRIRIIREGGRAQWAPVSAFSAGDQDYIHTWHIAEQIMSDKSLSIDIQRKRLEDKKTFSMEDDIRQNRYSVETEKIYFEITAENRTRDALFGLRIDYRCFIEVKSGPKNPERCLRMVAGSVVLNLAPRSEMTFDTRTINLREIMFSIPIGLDSNSIMQFNSTQLSRERYLGAWLKIHGPVLDGASTIRDVSWPEDLCKTITWDAALPDSDRRFNLTRFYITPPDEMKRWVEIREKTPGKTKKSYQDFLERALYQFKYPATVKEGQKEILAGLEFVYEADYEELNHMYAYDLAAACLNSGFFEDAILWFERAAAAGDDQAYEPLAALYASGPEEELHDGAKALQMAEKAVGLDPESASRQDLLARAYARNGEYDRAIKTQEKALEFLQRSTSLRVERPSYKRRLEMYRNNKPYSETGLEYYLGHTHVKPSQ